MAGAGYKLFVNGNTLSASDINTYLNQQTIMVFANTGARDTALTGVVAEGMHCYIIGTGRQYYNGSAWITDVTASSTSTLTNKTLTAPAISGSVSGTTILQGASAASGTLTLPAATDTLVGKATTDTLTNKTLLNDSLTGILENANIVASAATGTIAVDVITSTVWIYTTNASANFTLNFRGNSGTALNTLLATGQAITVVFLNTNGATPYYANVIQIDGTGVTPKWQGGTAPSSGNASAIDAYVFTILKTASATYAVLGAQTKFA